MAFLDPRLETLRQALHTFNTNSRELKNLLILSSDEPTFLELMADENGEALELAHAEVVRLLHNFLAAAFSLVDHARRVIDDAGLAPGTLLPEYRQRIANGYAKDPLHRFLQGLRAYTLHFEPPLTTARLEAHREGPDGEWASSCGFRLDATKLRSWDKWDDAAKRYLDGVGKTVDLLDLVREYDSRIKNLYSWFFKRLREEGLKAAGIGPGAVTAT